MDTHIIPSGENKDFYLSKKMPNMAGIQDIGQGIAFHKKTQKIVTAIYLVTNFLSEDNPLRHTLRHSSMKLLSLIGSIVFSVHPNPQKAQSEIRFHSNQIISALSVAFYSGYISEMNYRILEKELELFIDENSTLFSALKDNLNLSQFDLGPSNLQGQKSTISKSKNKSKRQSSPASNPDPESPVSIRKQSRKEAIISVLQKKGNVTIKDISEVISDCSEKTIQRELISLVKEGALKKSGERRWSTYSLA